MLEFLVVAAFAPQAAEWSIGAEREVDEGVYMQVVAADQGWRVWRTETRNGVRCTAIKSARGRRHPTPIGVGSMMTRDTPFLEVSWSPELSEFGYAWGATHFGGVRAKYRVPGARFWEEGRYGAFDPTPVGEQTVEVVIESYEYPAIDVGRAEERATLDLAGLAWAQSETRRCTESGRAG